MYWSACLSSSEIILVWLEKAPVNTPCVYLCLPVIAIYMCGKDGEISQWTFISVAFWINEAWLDYCWECFALNFTPVEERKKNWERESEWQRQRERESDKLSHTDSQSFSGSAALSHPPSVIKVSVFDRGWEIDDNAGKNKQAFIFFWGVTYTVMSVDVCTTQRKWEFSVVHMRHMLGCCGSHSAEVHVRDRTPVLHHTTDAAIAARFMLYLQSATLSVSAQDNTSAGSARWITATKKKKKKMWNSSSTSVEESCFYL